MTKDKKTRLPTYKIYTDGSFRRPNCGAWAAIIFKGKKKIATISGYEFDTTISRMELTAILEGLKYIKDPAKVIVYSDSQYALFSLVRWIKVWVSNNWKNASGGPVKNQDLLLQLYTQTKIHSIIGQWVKAHNGDEYNEECDTIVQDMTKKMVAGEIKHLGTKK